MCVSSGDIEENALAGEWIPVDSPVNSPPMNQTCNSCVLPIEGRNLSDATQRQRKTR